MGWLMWIKHLGTFSSVSAREQKEGNIRDRLLAKKTALKAEKIAVKVEGACSDRIDAAKLSYPLSKTAAPNDAEANVKLDSNNGDNADVKNYNVNNVNTFNSAKLIRAGGCSVVSVKATEQGV